MRSILFLLLTACAPQPEAPPAETGISDTSFVGFFAIDEGFVASLPDRSLGALLDDEGAWLGREADAVLVRTRAFGRGPAPEPVRAGAPEATDCAGPCLPGVVRAAPGITEWWVRTPAGFEQGWTIDEAPPGEAPLSVAVAIDGGVVVEDDGFLRIEAPGLGALTVSALVAEDALGRPLEAWFEADDAGFLVRVDDAGARYPLFIDPLYTTAATSLTGTTGINYGIDIAGAGDVNGDGYDDVIVGANTYSGFTGRAYVYLGSATGIGTTAATTLTGGTNEQFGYSVAGAGDVNDDGYDDVIVGGFGYSGTAGRAHIFHGGASGLSSTAATQIAGTALSAFGKAVAGAGDVNGDGYDDVIVGAPSYSGNIGRAMVYHGSASGVVSTAVSTLNGEATNNSFGLAVSTAGDVNGDGYDDVIVGASGYSGSTGRAYVFHGSSAGISSTATTTITGSSGNYLGQAVGGGGDVNNDGYDDVLVSAPNATIYIGLTSVYHGSASGVSTTATSTMRGDSSGDYFGGSAAILGDVDADGYDDVAVGAYGYSSNTGRVFVYPGGASGASIVEMNTYTGTATSQYYGWSVAAAGDVNGDGYPDLAFSAVATTSAAGFAEIYHGYRDADSDGILSVQDCDDTDATVGGGTTWNLDSDGDGYGVSSSTAVSCTQPTGYTANSADCDDTSAARSPADTEVCDSLNTDEDCDSLADDADSSAATATMRTWYADADSDGYGDPASATLACDQPAGHVADASDCDDTDGGVHPGADERCDASDTDEDCDGLSDDADPSAGGVSVAYRDQDSDGYGDASTVLLRCDLPAGYLTSAGDCDDTSASIHPGAAERCDASDTDEDCDGAADDADASVSAATQSTWALDADGDGFGGARTALACDPPLSYVATTGDCDDNDAAASPAGVEVCDGVDNNCDGTIDPPASSDATTWYPDDDGDGYGDAAGAQDACAQPNGFVDLAGDCDDADEAFHPGAEETCVDTEDYNCDGSTAGTDADNDGWPACEDCDDGDGAVSPSAAELCDGVDNDCDGSTDPASAADATVWYIDYDGDGYGSEALVQTACEQPALFVDNPDDCDDTEAAAYPNAEEVCDGVDNDCDGSTDPDCGTIDDSDPPNESDPPDDSGIGGGDKDPGRCSTIRGISSLEISLLAISLLAARRRASKR